MKFLADILGNYATLESIASSSKLEIPQWKRNLIRKSKLQRNENRDILIVK